MKKLIWRILSNAGLIVVSLGLLFGGVEIIKTQVPFWSLVYGLPAVFLGIILSLITFNELAQNRTAKTTEYHQIACKVCGKMSLVPMLTAAAVCSDCQYKMAVKLQISAIVFFILLAIPVTIHLAGQEQEIRQNAQEAVPTPMCEEGEWNPRECSCGRWSREVKCEVGEYGRSCTNMRFCCQKESDKWQCRTLDN